MSLRWPRGQIARSEPVPVAPRAWIRNWRRTRAWALIATLYGLVFAGLPFLSGGHSAGLTAFDVALAAAALVLAVRVVRSGVWIGADGLVVRGPFRTLTVAPQDAGPFTPGLQGRAGNGTPCPMLQRRGQRAVGVWALGQRNIWFRYDRLCQEIQPLCDELSTLVEAVRSP
jgi:hypothetical protein